MEISLYCKHFHITIHMRRFPPPRFNYGAIREAIRRLAMDSSVIENEMKDSSVAGKKTGAASGEKIEDMAGHFTPFLNDLPNSTTYEKFRSAMKAVARDNGGEDGKKLALFSMIRAVVTVAAGKRNPDDTEKYAKFIGHSTFLWLSENDSDGLSLDNWKAWIGELLRDPQSVLQGLLTSEKETDWIFFTIGLSIQIVFGEFQNDSNKKVIHDLQEWIFKIIDENARNIYQLVHRKYGLCKCLSNTGQGNVERIVAEIKQVVPNKVKCTLWTKPNGSE